MMKWLQILFNAISSASMINEFVRTKNLKDNTQKMYKDMVEYENSMFEKLDIKMREEIETLYSEMNALKFVVRFLFIAFILITFLLIIVLVFIVFLFRTRGA